MGHWAVLACHPEETQPVSPEYRGISPAADPTASRQQADIQSREAPLGMACPSFHSHGPGGLSFHRDESQARRALGAPACFPSGTGTADSSLSLLHPWLCESRDCLP